MTHIKELKLVVQTYRRFIDTISTLVEYSDSKVINFISSKNKNEYFSIFRKDYEILNSRIIASINSHDRVVVYGSFPTENSISCRTDFFSIDLQYKDSVRSIFRVEFVESEIVDLFSFLHKCMHQDFGNYHGILQFKNTHLFISYISNYIVEEEFKKLLLRQYMKSCNTIIQLISDRLYSEELDSFVLDYEIHHDYNRPYIKPLTSSYKAGVILENSLILLQSKNKHIYFDEVIPVVRGHLHEICLTEFQESIDSLLDIYNYDNKVIFSIKSLINSMLKNFESSMLDYNTLELYRDPDNQYIISDLGSCVLGYKNIDYDNNSFSLKRVGSEWKDFLNNIVYNIFETLSIQSFAIECVDKNHLVIVGDNGLKIDMGFRANYVDNYLSFRIVENKRLYLKGYDINNIPNAIRYSYLKNTFMYYLSSRSSNRYIDSSSHNSNLVLDMSDYVSNNKFLNFMFDCLARDYDYQTRFLAFSPRNFTALIEHCPYKYTQVFLPYYSDGNQLISGYKLVFLQFKDILYTADMKYFHLSIDHRNSKITISARAKKVSIDKNSLIKIHSKYDILSSIIECLGYEDKKDYETVDEFINVMYKYIYNLKCIKLVSEQEVVELLDHKSLNPTNIYDFVLQKISYSLEKYKLKNFFIKNIDLNNKTITLSSNVYEITLSNKFPSYGSKYSIYEYLLVCLSRDDSITCKSTIYFDNIDSFLDVMRGYKFYCPNSSADNLSKRMVVKNDYTWSDDTVINERYFELLYNNVLFEIRKFLLENGLSNFFISKINNDGIEFKSSDNKKVQYMSNTTSDLSNGVDVQPFIKSCFNSCSMYGNKRDNLFANIQEFWKKLESHKCMFDGVSLSAHSDRRVTCYLYEIGSEKVASIIYSELEQGPNISIKTASSDVINYTEYDNSNNNDYYPNNSESFNEVNLIRVFDRRNLSSEVNRNNNLMSRNLAILFASSCGGLLVLMVFLFCLLYQCYQNRRNKDDSHNVQNITLVGNSTKHKGRSQSV